jgi:hypothetical protein
MTIISTNEFNSQREQATTVPHGKPSIGEPIPAQYKERSPIENTFAFADPHKAHPRNENRDSAYINTDKNYAAYMESRFRNIPDYSNLYSENRNLKEVKGTITGKTYFIRRDPVFTYWHIDDYPGAFTKLDFAYNKIADLERKVEQLKAESLQQVIDYEHQVQKETNAQR